MSSLDNIWNILSRRNIEPLSEVFQLVNPFTYSVYTLTHSFNCSTNAFLGLNNDNAQCHIKILQCSDFGHLSQAYLQLQYLQQYQKELNLIKVLDVFEFLEDGAWGLVIVTEALQGLTLEELSQATTPCANVKDLVTKTDCTGIMLALFKIMESAQKLQLASFKISPNSVFLYKSDDPCAPIKGKLYNYSVKLYSSSRVMLGCAKSQLKHLKAPKDIKNTMEECLWDTGVSLYSLFGKHNLKEIPYLKTITHKERLSHLELRFQDPAISHILKHAFNDTPKVDLLEHPFIRVLSAFYNKDLPTIELCSLREFRAIHSAMTMEDKEIQLLAFKKTLTVALDVENHTELMIWEYLKDNDLVNTLLELSMAFSWEENPELLDSLFNILMYRPVTQKFKEQLLSLNFYSMIPKAAQTNSISLSLYKFFNRINEEDNTLTIWQLFWDFGLTKYAGKRVRNSRDYAKFIKETMSYYGPHSISFITEFEFLQSELSEIRVLQAFRELPLQFKIENSPVILEHLEKRLLSGLKNINKDEYPMLFKEAVLLLGDILCLPKMLQHSHLINTCLSHSAREQMSFLGKNPLLVECLDCGTTLCLVCANDLHSDHNLRHHLYMSAHSRCMCNETHEHLKIDPNQFALPTYPPRLGFVDSNGAEYPETHGNIFRSKGYLEIKTQEPIESVKSSRMKGYFEIKVIKAGTREDIEIELEGFGLSYYGMTGQVFLNKQECFVAPRFGSYDTVGIGCSSQGKGFVTYNGLLVPKLVDCNSSETFKPVVRMNGSECEAKLKLRSWLFKNTINPECLFYEDLLKNASTSFEILCNQIPKSFKRKKGDARDVDLIDKFVELVSALGLENYLKKTSKKMPKEYPILKRCA